MQAVKSVENGVNFATNVIAFLLGAALLVGVPVSAWLEYDTRHPCLREETSDCLLPLWVGGHFIFVEDKCTTCVERR